MARITVKLDDQETTFDGHFFEGVASAVPPTILIDENTTDIDWDVIMEWVKGNAECCTGRVNIKYADVYVDHLNGHKEIYEKCRVNGMNINLELPPEEPQKVTITFKYGPTN